MCQNIYIHPTLTISICIKTYSMRKCYIKKIFQICTHITFSFWYSTVGILNMNISFLKQMQKLHNICICDMQM